MRVRTLVAAAALGAAATLASGCGQDVLRPEPGRPVVLLVLNQTTQVDSVSVQPAFVLRQADGPGHVYAPTETFELRRVEDGARFGWRAVDRSGRIDFGRSVALPLSEANVFVPSEPAGGLGLEGIDPERRYRLRVETAGRTIRGTATVPGQIDLRRIRREDGVLVVWPRVEGAEVYRVTANRVFLGSPFRLQRLTTDTSVFVPDSVLDSAPAGNEDLRMVVSALDPNLTAYLRDESLERSGLDRGLGVFGGVTTDSVEVPVVADGR